MFNSVALYLLSYLGLVCLKVERSFFKSLDWFTGFLFIEHPSLPMESKTLLITGSFLVLLAGFMVLQTPADPSSNSPDYTYAWNCTDWNGTCEKVKMEYVKTDCTEWYVARPLDQLECERTKTGLNRLSLISDFGNYITTPMTDENYSVKTWLLRHNWTQPWDLEFTKGEEAFISLKEGEVLHLGGAGIMGNDTLETVVTQESGLLGLELHPGFEENRFIYLYYSHQHRENPPIDVMTSVHRLSRFKWVNGSLTNETVLLDGILGSTFHSGGRLETGPDGKLYLTTGDISFEHIPQNLSWEEGKLLRINLDGSIPEDNPFNDSYIYAYGFRNPQGIAWNPENDVMYTSGHGNYRYDEINRIVKGGNYGWGRYECDEIHNDAVSLRGDEYIRPVKCFKNYTMAPSGMVFVDEPGHPWHGDLFVAGLRSKYLHRLMIEDGEVVDEENFYVNTDSVYESGVSRRLRDVEYFNNSLYITGDFNGLIRLTPE